MVYDAVLDSQRQILAMMKPGVPWSDMHRLMWRVTLTHLARAGLVVGDVEEMLAANLGQTFTPHGLGHLIGVDTHDVQCCSDSNPRHPQEGLLSPLPLASRPLLPLLSSLSSLFSLSSPPLLSSLSSLSSLLSLLPLLSSLSSRSAVPASRPTGRKVGGYLTD